ncbi:YcxB family protein [Streptomyces sp. NPDC003717]|uniref:YcxB family protein n=1 Tax=Streptomyces sp. NPDC003717 TaxID=3154276 RepID=UPI0033A3C885
MAAARHLPVMVGVVIAAEVVGVAAGTGGLPPFVLVAAVGLAVALPLTPWLQARAFQRLAEWQGEFRATVTDRGTTVATAHTTVAADWVAQPRYRETDRVFVLLSADRNATGLTVLPKRGLAGPADADRLRALLDRHLTRC